MIQTAILTPDGLAETPYQAASLAEAVPFEPSGVYTVTRTFKRDHALLLNAHLDRLEESARLEGIPLQLNRPALRQALRILIERTANPDSRFRITVPRNDPTQLYLALEPLHPIPPEVRQQGVAVATINLHRQNPIAKSNEWMRQRAAYTAELPKNIYETLLLDEHGYLLEGSSSNFYAVLHGELRTADEGVLKGIARKALLEVIAELLPVRLEPIHVSELAHVSEAFLTSSSRGVLAIININGEPIADGTPQPITLELAHRYDAWTEAHIEPI